MQHQSVKMASIAEQRINVHEAIKQTLARRRQLFNQYADVFNNSVPDIHRQLRQTISEHKRAMHLLYLKSQITNSGKAA
jgi:hypothetical protein